MDSGVGVLGMRKGMVAERRAAGKWRIVETRTPGGFGRFFRGQNDVPGSKGIAVGHNRRRTD